MSATPAEIMKNFVNFQKLSSTDEVRAAIVRLFCDVPEVEYRRNVIIFFPFDEYKSLNALIFGRREQI